MSRVGDPEGGIRNSDARSQAIALVYRALHSEVRAYLSARIPGEADDILGEVFVAVTERFARFEGDEIRLRSWVFTIAHHRMMEHHRRKAVRRTDPLPNENLDVHAGAGNAELDALSELETRAALRRIQMLSPKQAEVVVLRVIGGLTAGEVALRMGLSEGAVRALQHRALHSLASSFEPEQLHLSGRTSTRQQLRRKD